MYLSKLLVINYRSCQSVELDLLKDEPNVLIGVNDCGKTSLLKGLELLLSERPQVFCIKDNAQKKDASNSLLTTEEFSQKFSRLAIPEPTYSGKEIVVAGKFIVEEADFDSEEAQQLSEQSKWALEKATDGLWYCRTFDVDGKLKHFLLLDDCKGQDGELQSFFQLKATPLNKKRTEFALSQEEIENGNRVGRFSNMEIIRALYSKLGTEKCWVEWKWEKGLFPSFRYLDWNSSFDNILESATEALKELIDEHLTPVRQSAKENALKAQTALNDRLRGQKNIIATILPQVQELTANIHFEVKEKITDLLIEKLGADGPVHMDLQGDGIKRQIWFALIKAAAVSQETTPQKRHIWAFDEPETHLYPTAQRQLFEIIREVSTASIQSLISTHSTVFIDKSNLAAIKIVAQQSNYTVHSNCESIDEIFHSLELRNSDFLFYDRFLIVEGDTEEYLIPSLYQLYTGKTLVQDNIQLVVLRGASNFFVQKRALENVFDGFKKSTDEVKYLFDGDQKHELGNDARLDNLHFIGKQDIEDSLPSDTWVSIVNEVYPGEVVFSLEDIDEIKESIPSDKRVDKHSKFIPLLNKRIRAFAKEKNIETFDAVPAKGQDLAAKILTYLTHKEQIPIAIQACFDQLASKEDVTASPVLAEVEEFVV